MCSEVSHTTCTPFIIFLPKILPRYQIMDTTPSQPLQAPLYLNFPSDLSAPFHSANHQLYFNI